MQKLLISSLIKSSVVNLVSHSFVNVFFLFSTFKTSNHNYLKCLKGRQINGSRPCGRRGFGRFGPSFSTSMFIILTSTFFCWTRLSIRLWDLNSSYFVISKERKGLRKSINKIKSVFLFTLVASSFCACLNTSWRTSAPSWSNCNC